MSNHLASCGYLRGFTAADGKVAVVNVKSRQLYCRRPENVAFRNYFWGREQKLRDEVEGLLSRIEDHVPRILDDLVRYGPPSHGSADRALLLQFLAMHFVRNTAWRALIERTLEHQIAVRGHHGPRWARLREQLRADRYWIDTMLRQIPQVASLLGSTQWALLRFPHPWLATCDQPLIPLALLPQGARVPVGETPPLLETIEFRFVVNPSHALILSWHDAPDWTAWAMADQLLAAEINRSVVGRTDVEYFHRPDAKPPFVAPPWTPTDECNPISPRLDDGYWRETAVHSQRRRRADKLVLRAIEQDVSHQIETVVVTAPAA
ncbi:MAG: DUF4238 domain-containing protein [Actinomycetota bacterium]|nr:DUF4238 domain-containing protein [Actinomycetota bacterium]